MQIVKETKMKSSKPRDLELCSYGTGLKVKLDSKMTNIWLDQTLLSYGKAKQLKVWLEKYLKYVENLRELK